MSRLIRSSSLVLLWFFSALVTPAPVLSSGPDKTAAAPETAAADTDKSNADVIATVNGEPVFAQDIESRLKTLHSTSDAERAVGGMDMDNLMAKVVNDVLLGQEARTLGLDEERSVREKVTAYRRDLITALLSRDTIGDRADPTDEETAALCRERYQATTLRVVTAYEKDDALKLRQELDKGADMETMARDKSVDPYSLRGGLMDKIPRRDLQRDIAEVAFTLSPGDVAGPIRTDLGYSIIRVESFTEATPETLADAKLGCRQVVRMVKQREIEADLAVQSRERAVVTTFPDVIAAVVPEEGPDGRLMPRAPEEDAVVASIGETQVITVREYTKALVKSWSGVRNLEAAMASAPIVLNGLIERKILLAEAQRRGYDQEPRVQRAVHAFETQTLIPLYLNEAVVNTVSITQEQVEAYYQAHRQEYNRPPRVRLGQITVATLEEAERLVAQLRAGADLAWLAQQHSLDQYKGKAGARGWYVPQPDVEDFNMDLLAAETGSVLEPFGVPGNYVILKVIDREEQGIYELAQISGNVRAQAEQAALLLALDDFMKKLLGRAEIRIDEDRLALLSVTGRPEASEGSHAAGSISMEGHGD